MWRYWLLCMAEKGSDLTRQDSRRDMGISSVMKRRLLFAFINEWPILEERWTSYRRLDPLEKEKAEEGI